MLGQSETKWTLSSSGNENETNLMSKQIGNVLFVSFIIACLMAPQISFFCINCSRTTFSNVNACIYWLVVCDLELLFSRVDYLEQIRLEEKKKT